jgi:type I restriction enzyme, S subunit
LQMAYGKFWVNNHTHVLQGAGNISTEYLYMSLSNVGIAGYITGAAQPKINQANLNRIPIVVPPDDLLLKFNAIFEAMFDMIELLERKNANLRRTRDLLLPRLVSGEVGVEGIAVEM